MSKTHTITRHEAQLRAAALDVQHYQLHLDVTDDAEFTVRAVVSFTTNDAVGQDTFIDLLGHQEHSAQLKGQDIRYDGARINLAALQTKNEMIVHSSAPYSTTSEGLHRFVDPFDEAEYLYSQCEPADARRIFPVFEQPDLKATFGLEVTAPAHWAVLSNEPGTQRVDGDVAHWEFADTPLMSSYLFALIAGEYVQVATDSWDERVPLGIWARKSLAKFVDAEQMFQITRAGFAFY